MPAPPIESCPQSPHQLPEPNQAAQDSYASPEAHAFVLTGSSKNFCRLPDELADAAEQHSDRDALCVAVATADESSPGIMNVCDYAHWAGLLHIVPAGEAWHCGLVLLQNTQLEHILCASILRAIC